MKKSILVFALIISALFFVSTVSGAGYYTDYGEDFEDDAAGGDPSGFYTFTDGLWYASEVVENQTRNGNHSYWIYTNDGLDDYTWFNWTSDSHTYYELWFKIDNFTHDDIGLHIGHTAGVGNEVRIYGKDYVDAYVIYSNYTTEGWNRTISNNTWWKLRWDFNYTSNETRCRLYNNASVEQTSANTTWLLTDPETGVLEITDTTGIVMYGYTGKHVAIWFDDMQLSKYQTGTRLKDSGINVGLVVLLSVVIIFAVLMFLIDMMQSKKLEIQKLAGVIIIVVMLMVIMSLI